MLNALGAFEQVAQLIQLLSIVTSLVVTLTFLLRLSELEHELFASPRFFAFLHFFVIDPLN